MVETLKLNNEVAGASAYVLALREALLGGDMEGLGTFELGDLNVEVCTGADSIWAIVRRKGAGGLALRAVHAPSCKLQCRKVTSEGSEALQVEVESVVGRHRIRFWTSDAGLHRMRMEVTFTPVAPLLVPFLPRDLYPLDIDDDPLGAQGNVEAAQRGVNSGLLYFRLEPDFGSVLYFQNFSALNPWFRATQTTPDGAVGGEWPELGFLPPTPPQSGTPPTNPLPAGEELVTSDAILVFRDWAADNEAEMARQFLQMLGTAYRALELPEIDYRDWAWRAGRTLADLESAEVATVTEYGNRYVMPYPEGEYPDLMVQMSVIAGLHDYGKWLGGRPLPLEEELKKGLGRFYDPKLRTARRYLPNVGDDKDADAVDSWYYYHPLLNLGRLALQGDAQCRDLLLKSIDYGIKAAHHFEYHWPIMYKAQDFSVITEARNDDRFGQTDVGGLYAYVMLQLFELTDEKRYLDEARAAIDAALGTRFDLMYQANLTAWGAAACIRLWRITNEQKYIDHGYVYLASFFHNCEIWESQIGHAVHYRNFLGVTCLHDAPYMAIYECFDSFTAFEDYLSQSGPDLDPEVRMLISEYCKYSLDRAWFYYPDVLPKEILATEHQSGTIHRNLSFPLEDLYGDGQEAGQIGQEIYGSAAAFIYATRSHHEVEGAPFQLFCNLFLRARERTGHRAMTIVLDGGESCTGLLSLARLKRRKMPKPTLTTADGDAIRPHASSENRIDYRVPANGRLILTWE